MQKFLFKRLLALIPIVLGVTFIVFSILAFTPGDPARIILGMKATPEAVAKLNHELGADRPFLARYVLYIQKVVTGFDFGVSYRTKLPVFAEIEARFPYTIRLAFAAVLLASIIGIPIGILSAVKQYSLADNLSRVTAMFLAAVPGFWLGMMLILAFSLSLGWLPSSGADTWKHYILPTCALGLPAAASLLRMTRSTMLETIRQDYIRTARAKGAPEPQVIWRHALKNALLPVITVLGVLFSYMLGGTIIIEMVFAMPGMGTFMIDAIRSKDVPSVMSATIILATIFCLVMLLVDLAYAWIDPRVKARFAK